jgi:cytochrome c-type biogenesis protein CcmH
VTQRVCLSLLTLLALVGACRTADRREREIAAIESHLLAPCCWLQTLDTHQSPITTELRGEITRRVNAGESALAIEDDLVARYGDRLRAVPRESDFGWLTVVGIVAAVLAFGVAIHLGRRWTRRSQMPYVPPPPRADSRYEDMLDDELDDAE